MKAEYFACRGWGDPGTGKPAPEEWKKSTKFRGYVVDYFPMKPGYSQCFINGIGWDEEDLAVLAHEIGHYMADNVGELDAWRNAAVLFGNDIVTDNQQAVREGLLSYGFTEEAIDSFIAEFKEPT